MCLVHPATGACGISGPGHPSMGVWETPGPGDPTREPRGPLGQDTPPWEPEAGPSPGPGASTNLLELLAILGAEDRACHPTRQMRKTDSEARCYLGASNGSLKACAAP